MASRPHLLTREHLLPAPVQARSIAKRHRIARAALVLFAERGYERTSLEDIAAKAGVAVGGVYLYFRSKRQLLLVLMDELLERLDALTITPPVSGDARSAIHELLRSAFATDIDYIGAYQAWNEAARADTELAVLDRKIHRWTSQRVERVFELLQRAPGARTGVKLSALARMMDVLFWYQLGQMPAATSQQARESIDTMAHLVYHALFADAPARQRR